MRRQEFSVIKLVEQLQSESDAYVMLERLRWTGKPVCPHCGVEGDHYFLKPSNGTSRATRTGAQSQRRVWKCREKACRKQFSVLTGTIFHGTKISIRTWLLVIFEVCAAKNSVSAWEIARKYDITNESAWHMLHRLRFAMEREPLAGLLSGIVQADETFIGGDPKNRHANDPREVTRKASPSKSDKVAVFSLIHWETREVRSVVVPDVTGATLLPAMREQADIPRLWLHTDGARAYEVAAKETLGHEWVDHSAGQYVGRNAASTNTVEGYFSQLKRSLDGTHHHVSREHLHRYLAQFDWLYTHCRRTDSERMRLLIGGTAGRRLTYSPLISRA